MVRTKSATIKHVRPTTHSFFDIFCSDDISCTLLRTCHHTLSPDVSSPDVAFLHMTNLADMSITRFDVSIGVWSYGSSLAWRRRCRSKKESVGWAVTSRTNVELMMPKHERSVINGVSGKVCFVAREQSVAVEFIGGARVLCEEHTHARRTHHTPYGHTQYTHIRTLLLITTSTVAHYGGRWKCTFPHAQEPTCSRAALPQ